MMVIESRLPEMCWNCFKRMLSFALLVTSLAVPASWLVEARCEASAKDKPGSAPVSLPKARTPVKVDGDLDDEAWLEAWRSELEYEVSPGENVPAPVRTEVLITYDESHLYVGFRCYDPDPSAIRAYLSDRDKFHGGDWVAIALDTFNDERSNFHIWSNPYGVQADGTLTWNSTRDSAGTLDFSWDAIYDSAGRIFDWGFAVEMAIPFSSLKFQRTAGSQIWGIDVFRMYPRDVRHLLGLFPRDRSNTCYQCQFVKIEGFEDISPGLNLQIIPTLTSVRTDARTDLPGGNFETQTESVEAGLTTHWGFTPNLTLSVAVNPDFSHVEADVRQLDTNQPMALFYPEKRPFFTEGSDIFLTSVNGVYTRTIREPLWGIKLTGKEGVNTIGAYIVRDESPSLIIPGSQESHTAALVGETLSSVFRYKRDFGSRYTLGMLLTDREGEDYSNRVAGVDGSFRITDSDVVNFQLLGSSTRYPQEIVEKYGQPEGSFGDFAAYLQYRHKTRKSESFISLLEKGPDFRADLGFEPRTNYRRVYAGSNYRWDAQPGSWWSSFLVEGGAYHSRIISSGDLLQEYLSLEFLFEGTLQTSVKSKLYFLTHNYYGQEFDRIFVNTAFKIRPIANAQFTMNTSIGDKIDFANARLGRRVMLNPGSSLNLSAHLYLSVDHTFEQMIVNDAKLYTANISQGTLVYQFNTRTFVRAILQYVNYSYNVDNYTFEIEPEDRNMFTQFLFSYKINPQTVLFVGYSDNYLGNRDFAITQTDRTFFLKLGYAWQL